MTIEEFASLYRLRRRKDSCGEQIIPGKLGHIFDHGAGKFGIVLEDTSSGPSRARVLLSRRRAALKAGFSLTQQGDCESVLLFDPFDTAQARKAIRLVRARKKRLVQSSPASLNNLIKAPTQMPPQAVETAQQPRMTSSP